MLRRWVGDDEKATGKRSELVRLVKVRLVKSKRQ
jgi:hypothetical protein